MPVEVKITTLQKMLDVITEKEGQPQDRYGLKVSADNIKGLSTYYLYRTIYKGIEEAKKEKRETLILQPIHLDKIAKYLGYKNTADLIDRLSPAINPLLLTCEGNYYCYLRRNSEDAYILRSPVQIERKQGEMIFTLQGPVRKYSGTISIGNGCLFVLILHEDGKQFHHIYQLGQHKTPQVLQGIFSGVSTVFSPIGGRTVLIRTDEEYETLKNKEIEISTLHNSRQLQDRRLAEYFEHYDKNNLNIKRVNTFRIDDLGTCK